MGSAARWLRRALHPIVAYDAEQDVWLIFGLESPFHYTVFVRRSTDGAQTFDAPMIVRRLRLVLGMSFRFPDVQRVTGRACGGPELGSVGLP